MILSYSPEQYQFHNSPARTTSHGIAAALMDKYLIILLDETNKLSMAVAKKQKIDTVTAPT